MECHMTQPDLVWKLTIMAKYKLHQQTEVHVDLVIIEREIMENENGDRFFSSKSLWSIIVKTYLLITSSLYITGSDYFDYYYFTSMELGGIVFKDRLWVQSSKVLVTTNILQSVQFLIFTIQLTFQVYKISSIVMLDTLYIVLCSRPLHSLHVNFMFWLWLTCSKHEKYKIKL